MPERPRPTDASQFDAKNERARQMVEQGFQSLVEELKQGKSEHLMRYLDFCARFHRYSPVVFVKRIGSQLTIEKGTSLVNGLEQ